ncbi:8-methylmenaquinol:fumarate reductase membrane anchor subunit [Fundidesulfovibrio magnetotacticus]|uniref:8-methylmenaquinol:fumarate reductase membrane anchor subunit n=1 Tax=Fundidesulfovibrio magnetotacticus TaxID=2730080 RepID=A0A6V8LNW5_9BACT|nr:CoB--CoM heterodisulfide reductase iron-sulfur subunit B family protein [Fundidesulfovibrio magnetotacticus]GFK92201.1 8-methylmenaquinol:fumarate reductase membrane anchor subunit [Fundidesulfovibrio magnetotacticus]
MSGLSYAYYPGCSGLGTSSEYDSSTRAVCKALFMELSDVPDWSCCGSSPAHAVDHALSAALSARNLARVRAMDRDDVLTPCPSCLTNLRTADHRMRDEAFAARANSLLDAPYKGGVRARSVLQAIVEDVGMEMVRASVVRPLKGMKVAAYYGCIMNRPPELMAFDDPEHPMAMDLLMEAAGATVLPFPLKVECCGASFGVPRPDVTARLSARLLLTAREIGAEAIVTACPLCQMNLDLRQNQAARFAGTAFEIPVFYFTQLLGLALGAPEGSLGLDKLCVSPARVLEAPAAGETNLTQGSRS